MFNKFFLITVRNHKSASLCTTSSRLYSQDFKIIKNVDTASLPRGTGGRSSFNGNVVTVFGATGFSGKYICNELGKTGTQIIIPYRCDSDDDVLKSLKLVGDLGQVLFQPFYLKDPVSIRKAIKYSNIVINLIGSDFESSNFSYHQVHVKGARDIAAACREMNVERLIHFSSLNVTENPERYYVKKINFFPTKLEGEHAVLEEYPTATIFRPSSMYGFYDKFLWPLCTKYRCCFDSIPLYAKGEKTIKQPVFVNDVAKAVSVAVNDYSTRGKIYQAVGPERYYLKDIAIFCGQVLQRHHFSKILVHDLKYDITYFLKVILCRYILECLVYSSVRRTTFEYIERESVTDIVNPCLPTLSDLNVSLTNFEDVVPNFIYKTFKKYPLLYKSDENYGPPDCLSAKAVKEYSF